MARHAEPVTPGVLIVDKPGGMTSHDVVSRLRRILGTRRVGHAGTLDPMATGVLVIGVGAATRLLTYLVGLDKAYEATIRLGQSTSTDDAEGEILQSSSAGHLGRDQILAAIATLTGEIDQVPSSVSAIKVAGKRAYARVREGEELTLQPRRITVSAFDLLDLSPAELDGLPVLDLDVRTEVSSGTYVRALARDLGEALGVGGHLTALRRTRVGPFLLTRADTLATIEESPSLLSPAEVAAAVMPVRAVGEAETRALGYGQRLAGIGAGPGPSAAVGADGSLIAIVQEQDGQARPLLVFAAR